MFHINDDIKKPWKLSRWWFNAVAKFLNNICGDGIINIARPDEPSAMTPIRLSINIDALRNKLKYDNGSAPFRVTVEMSTASTPTVEKVFVYLPATTVRLSGQDWSISGLPTGFTRGNFQITGSGAGKVWLKLKRTDGTGGAEGTYAATFAYSTDEPTDCIYYEVATVAADGTVTQYEAPLAGAFTENSGLDTEIGTPKFRENAEGIAGQNDTSRMFNEGLPSGDPKYAFKTDEWNFGEALNGTRVLTISRIEVDNERDVAEHYMYFRCETRDATGRTIHISKELGCVKILA